MTTLFAPLAHDWPCDIATAAAMTMIAVWLAALADSDRRHMRLPNRLVLPGVMAVMASGCVQPVLLLAAGACGGIYLVVFGVGGCGGGDVKLAFVLGGMLGHLWMAVSMVVLAALVQCALFVAVVPARASSGSMWCAGHRMPHGPVLISAFAGVVALL